MEQKYYHMNIVGCERDLPLCPLNEHLMIGAFVIFGDPELTTACAAELLRRVPAYDYIITAEAKGIQIFRLPAESEQHLYVDGEDAARMKGKRILIVDDVVSTGESLHALETLVNEARGIICGRACILAEGEAADRSDLVYLEKLPLFDAAGNPLD